MSKKKSKEIFQWTDDTEIIGVTLTLKAIYDLKISLNYTTALHAWFLHQVRNSDPQLSAYLHDGQSKKAFTISPLIGNLEPKDKKLFIAETDIYTWTISALSKPLCDWLKVWCNHYPSELNLSTGRFVIEKISVTLPATTYNFLWSMPLPKRSCFTLTFLSPTCFSHKNHHLPLPIPANIFHSYLRRWNHFAPEAFPQEEFLSWIDQVVYITNYDLTCTKVVVAKQGFVTGFVGNVEFGVNRKKAFQNEEFERLLSALIQLAPYCSTGYKSTFGLGQTRLLTE